MQFLDIEIMVKSKKKKIILIINKIKGFFVHVTCYDCMELEKKCPRSCVLRVTLDLVVNLSLSTISHL